MTLLTMLTIQLMANPSVIGALTQGACAHDMSNRLILFRFLVPKNRSPPTSPMHFFGRLTKDESYNNSGVFFKHNISESLIQTMFIFYRFIFYLFCGVPISFCIINKYLRI